MHRLAPYYRPDERYVEPFAGSAALFFSLKPRSAVLGDLNSDLIGTYEAIRSWPTAVTELLEGMPENDKDYYYDLRRLDPSELGVVERAARFIYLNRYCFNGLYRTNKQGQFNVPFSGRRNGSLPGAEIIADAADRLRAAELVAGDFVTTLNRAREGDFVYLDPPYWNSQQRVFREYDSKVFGKESIEQLVEAMCALEKKRIRYMLSYGDSPEGAWLGRGRLISRIEVRRNIAGFTDSRRSSVELLITPRYVSR